MKRRIGILTGGGDCPGLNTAIRAITKGAINSNYDVIAFKDGYKGLVENDFLLLNNAMVSGIINLGGTILGTSNAANPYQWPSKSDGKLKFKNLSKKAVANFKKHKLSGLIVIGGDGSMAIADRLYKDGIPVIGVPKTIDNDLPCTDITFGFETAVVTATEAIDKIHTTAQSHHRVMVVEVMGRYAGWIALYSGIASGGDIILIPEIPFHMKYVYRKIKERKQQGKNFTIVVVAEGAKPYGGKLTISSIAKKSTDPVRLGGIGVKIAQEIEKNLDIESRATILGHVQRGGNPTPFDRILATKFGAEALKLLKAKQFGTMVTIENNNISNVLLSKISNKIKLVSKDHPLILTAQLVGTSFGDN